MSSGQPAIILVAPQLGENIGAAARAMANFGLTDLRIVNPRDGWPNPNAKSSANGAEDIVAAASLYGTAAEAVADLRFVFATTARAREVAKPVQGPKDAAAMLHGHEERGEATGVLFGRERYGLANDEVALADEILTLPVDPKRYSLNLAQAVLLIAYEWRNAAVGPALPFAGADDQPGAEKAELIRMFEHLESALDVAGFFRPPEKRQHMVLALRSMLQRAHLSDQEVRTFRGVIAALEDRPTRPRRLPDGKVITQRGGNDEG